MAEFAVPTELNSRDLYAVDWNFSIVPERRRVGNRMQLGGMPTFLIEGADLDASVVSDLSEPNVGTLLMWPNPAQDILYVTLPAGFGESLINVMDVSGREVIVQQSYSTAVAQLSVEHLASGVYTVHVLGDDGKVSQGRFVR